jgi:hypothetical protein
MDQKVNNEEKKPIEELYESGSINKCKFEFGLNSKNYGISEEDDHSFNFSSGTILPVKVNNKGYAVVLIYPHFLISRELMSCFRLGSKKIISNIFIANEDDKTPSNLTRVMAVPSPSITPMTFDTYRVQKWEVRYKFYNPIEKIEKDDYYDEDNYINFKVVDGKPINFITDMNLYFENHILKDLIQNDNNPDNEYIATLDQIHRYYTSSQRNMGEFKYNKNGFNNAGQVPMNVTNDSDEQLVSRQVLKYMNYSIGNIEKYAPNFIDDVPSTVEMNRKVDYVSTILNSNETASNIFDNNNQMNDKIIKIIIKSRQPYAIVELMINFYFTIKAKADNSNNIHISGSFNERFVPKLSYTSKNGVDLVTAMSTTRQENTTMDGELVTNDIIVQILKDCDMLTDDEIDELKGIGDWFRKAWDKTKEIAVKVKDAVVDFIKPKSPLEAAGEIITSII